MTDLLPIWRPWRHRFGPAQGGRKSGAALPWSKTNHLAFRTKRVTYGSTTRNRTRARCHFVVLNQLVLNSESGPRRRSNCNSYSIVLRDFSEVYENSPPNTHRWRFDAHLSRGWKTPIPDIASGDRMSRRNRVLPHGCRVLRRTILSIVFHSKPVFAMLGMIEGVGGSVRHVLGDTITQPGSRRAAGFKELQRARFAPRRPPDATGSPTVWHWASCLDQKPIPAASSRSSPGPTT
jgi:hypothetical protein